MGRAYSTNEREQECTQVFGRRTEGMGPLGTPRRSLEDSIKMDFRERESEYELESCDSE
jgi:hypothetical protein